MSTEEQPQVPEEAEKTALEEYQEGICQGQPRRGECVVNEDNTEPPERRGQYIANADNTARPEGIKTIETEDGTI